MSPENLKPIKTVNLGDDWEARLLEWHDGFSGKIELRWFLFHRGRYQASRNRVSGYASERAARLASGAIRRNRNKGGPRTVRARKSNRN